MMTQRNAANAGAAERLPSGAATLPAASGMRISFRFKLAGAMFLAIALVVTISMVLAQGAVERNFTAMLSEQFRLSAESYNAERQRSWRNLSYLLTDATESPRLAAALEIGRHDEYERFYYDLSEQLEETLLRLREDEAARAPFFRFVDYRGNYLNPPDSLRSTLGIEAMSPEKDIQEDFIALSTARDKEIVWHAGYLLIPDRAGSQMLHEVLVVPTSDPDGYHMGDLILATPQIESRFANENDSYQGIMLSGVPFIPTLPKPWIEPFAEQVSGATAPDRVTLGGEPFAVFQRPLTFSGKFPPATQVSLFSLRPELALIRELRASVLSFGALAGLVGVGLSLFAATQLTRAIRQLVLGTNAVAAGDLETRVPITSRDEIGDLTRSFNEMMEGLALKEKYRGILDKVTDREVARTLLSGNLELGGEEREVSILFCDVRSFTATTENMPPREVIEMLNEHMTSMTRIVYSHSGVVDKFVGDEIMVLFGAPRSYGNDALNAVQCAQAMLKERYCLSEQGRWKIQVGIGIATGPVVAGNMGSQDRSNYTVLGERVNLAARLCGAAKAGTLLIDETTRDRLQSALEVTAVDALSLKGFSRQIPVYQWSLSEPVAT